MIIVQKRSAPREPADVDLVLPFEQRQKSRLRTVLATGEEVGLFLERGAILRDGDCLESDDGRIVRVVAADETLMEVRTADAELLARAAYHLGNRHTPVQIGMNWLRFAADRVLAEMLSGLGLTAQTLSMPFEPEAGAYAAGHAHHSGEARHAGVIHDFALRRDEPR